MKARILGADAVIKAVYHPSGLGTSASATSVAVMHSEENQQICPKCKKVLPEGKFSFCPHCGASLTSMLVLISCANMRRKREIL